MVSTLRRVMVLVPRTSWRRLSCSLSSTPVAHKRVLIANRGEIALRIMRAVAAEGGESVAIYAREDANSAHVLSATRSVVIGTEFDGGSLGGPVAPYLDVDAVVNAALETRAEAVHPGYGFLSESPALARALASKGIAFVGPPVSALEAFGDKVQARRLAKQQGVPVAAGSEEEDLKSGADVARWLERSGVGYPIMLKAAHGGGGRGMRVVRSASELDAAFERCASEALSAFGDGTVFVEELVEDAKHLEVQVLWDSFGRGVHLWERDCSVQRRNQKVIEWAPSRNLHPDLRRTLTEAALNLTKAAGYVNAGTVEFLVKGALDDPSSRAYFMEVNPRIQVEHTVTEEAFGVDLVRAQLQISAGAELGVWPAKPKQWAVQCRISAASQGKLSKYVEPKGCRVDSAASPWKVGDVPSTSYDPLLSKLIITAPYNGFEAVIDAMKRALREYKIEGVATNLAQLRDIVDHPSFKSDDVKTRFLEDIFDVQEAEDHGDDGPEEESVISSPMPCEVITVAKLGEVKRGEVVCVVSAMKIEMELRADVGGVVTAVHVKPGDRVEAGAALVNLKGRKAALKKQVAKKKTTFKVPAVWAPPSDDFKDNDDAFQTNISLDTDRFEHNAHLASELRLELAKAASEGRDSSIARHRGRGKHLPRERIAMVCDEGSEVMELSALAAHGMYGSEVPSAGLVTAIGIVGGREVLFVANDATVKGGSYHPVTVKKHLRAQAIAQRLMLPCAYLVDSGGAFLPLQAEVFPDRDHFGRIFYNQSRLSAQGIPQIAAVLGSCTAGGAYVPAMADENLIVRGNGTIFLAGPPLVEAATGEKVSAQDLGGAETHTKLSGLADHVAEDEDEALFKLRSILSSLPKDDLTLHSNGEPPAYSAESIYAVLPKETSTMYDPRELIARFVDSSTISEFKQDYGITVVTAFVKVAGMDLGIVANAGVLTSEASKKAAHFVELCNSRKIPLLFLQNCTGFVVGREAEAQGIAKDGSKLVAAVSCASVPKITLLVGASFGAANYGMCGRAFEPDFLFSYPNSKLAVMGPAQAASTLLTVKKAALAAKNHEPMNLQQEAAFKTPIEADFEAQASPYYATARLWDDGIIDPAKTRVVLARALSLASRANNNNTPAPIGRTVFRM